MLQLIKQLLNDIRDSGLERLVNRYYGIYQCQVIDNNDTEKRGRIRVKGNVFPGSKEGAGGPKEEAGLDIWIPPKSYYTGVEHGIFFPPEENAYVFIAFVDGDYGRPFYDGGFWTSDAGSSKAPFQNIQTTVPSIRGIKTTTGYEVIFAEKNSENSSPYFKIRTPKEQVIIFDDKDGVESVTLKDKNNNSYVSNKDGIIITDTFGNEVVMNEDGIRVNGEFIVRESFLHWLNDYKATIGTGNQGAPVPLFPPALTKFLDGYQANKDKFMSNR